MMNRIFPTLGLLLFLSFNMSAAGPLKPFPKDGKWGFVDKDMNIVVPCVYDAVSSFDNGIAIVSSEGRFGYIDQFGSVLYPIEYEMASPFHQAHAFVVKDGLLGLLNIAGDVTFDYKIMKRFALPVEWVDTPARFIGDASGDFLLWVDNNKKYPEAARRMGVSGVVEVEFNVGLDGKVTDVKALTSANPDLDKEAVRVVSSSPAWEPARMGDLPFMTRFTVMVSFSFPAARQ